MIRRHAAATELYAAGQHPRLLLGPSDLPAIKRRASRGNAARILHALRQKAAFFASQVLDDPQWRKTLESAKLFWPMRQASFVWGLADMAMIATLDDDARMRDAVTQVFTALPWLGYDPKQGTLVNTQFYMPPVSLPYAYDLAAPWLPADVRRAYVEWAARAHVKQVIAALSPFYLRGAGINIPLGGMEQAVLTALAIMGDLGAPSMEAPLQTLLRWLEAAINTAVTPDGYPAEDIGYGTVVVPTLMQVAFAAQRAGLLDIRRRTPRLLRFGRAMLHFTQPFGEHLSLTGDHGDQFRDRQFALGVLAEENDDPSLRWLIGTLSYAHYRTLPGDDCVELDQEATLPGRRNMPISWLSLATLDELRVEQPAAARAPASVKPAIPTAFLDHARGLVSARSGWRADDTLLVVDAGQRSPATPGHHHASSGHFSITARGELFAIDTGRYNIEQSQHNVVLIDGKSGRSTDGQWVADYHPGRLIEFSPNPLCDFTAVDSSHAHDCMWAWRSVGLVKPGRSAKVPAYVWTVDDINKNNAGGEFWWTLNTCPGNTIHLHDDHAIVEGARRGAMLDVHLAIPPAAEFGEPHTLTLAQDVNTTSSHKYVADPARSAALYGEPANLMHGPVFLRPRLIARVAGVNGRFMAVMIPRGKGELMSRFTQLKTVENALAFRLEFNDPARTVDTLVWAFDHDLLEADGIVGRGQWCLVRRSMKSGRVVAHQLHRGVMLEADGKKLV